MTIKDIGPQPQSFDLERATRENESYRTVAWSGRYLQVTLMSIPVGSDIGLEMHPDTDQFLRLDAGRGRAQIGPSKDQLTFDRKVSDGWCVLIPAGTWHTVTNIGDDPCRSMRSMRRRTTSRARCTGPQPMQLPIVTTSRRNGRFSLVRRTLTNTPDRYHRRPSARILGSVCEATRLRCVSMSSDCSATDRRNRSLISINHREITTG